MKQTAEVRNRKTLPLTGITANYIWRLETKTEQTSYSAYKGKSTAFWLFLTDDGHNLTGNAEKFQFDAKDLPVAQHQRMKVTGQISGGDVILDYKERAGLTERHGRPAASSSLR